MRWMPGYFRSHQTPVIMRILILLLLLLSFQGASAQWVSVPPGGLAEFESVLVDDAERFLVAGGDGATFRTTDGGATWAAISGLGVESIRDLLRLDDQTILAAGDGVVMRSTDNGATWTTINTPATDDLHGLARNGNTVIAVGRSGWIVRSLDAGLTWSGQVSGTTERLFCVAMVGASSCIAAGKNGVFLRSSDVGGTWTAATLPASDDWVGAHFFQASPLIGLICGEGGSLVRTTDGGATWAAINTGSPMGLGGLASAHDSVVYAAGSTGTALKSVDQGLTWNTMTSPAFSALGAIDVRNGAAVAAGANGTVIKLVNGSGVGIEERVNSTALSIFPNPATDHVQYRWAKGQRNVERVDILAMDGRTVYSELAVPGSTQVGLSALPSGSYLLRLRSRDGTLGEQYFAVVK